jgi:hypothetical protein
MSDILCFVSLVWSSTADLRNRTPLFHALANNRAEVRLAETTSYFIYRVTHNRGRRSRLRYRRIGVVESPSCFDEHS